MIKDEVHIIYQRKCKENAAKVIKDNRMFIIKPLNIKNYTRIQPGGKFINT